MSATFPPTIDRMRVALIGTRGVPARYGGFETAIEEIGSRLASRGHKVLVFGRAPDGEDIDQQPDFYRGMRTVFLPAARKRSLETLSHTGLSLAWMLRRSKPDAAIVFNAANSPWLPVLRAMGVPVATHVDGLEWRRDKWNSVGKAYYRVAEQLAVRWSDALIADAQGIADYYDLEFAAPTELLTYGAPITEPGFARLEELGLEHRGYHLMVARFERENHVHLIVEGYVRSRAKLPLVVVGSAPYADEYTAEIHALADDRVRFLGGVWDQDLLDQLYAGALTYVHGHSVGGTNPSLLRALGAGAPVLAYDVCFNREVVGRAGSFFKTADDVAKAIEVNEANLPRQQRRSKRAIKRASAYDWDEVTDGYEELLWKLAYEGQVKDRPSGRRSGKFCDE